MQSQEGDYAYCADFFSQTTKRHNFTSHILCLRLIFAEQKVKTTSKTSCITPMIKARIKV